MMWILKNLNLYLLLLLLVFGFPSRGQKPDYDASFSAYQEKYPWTVSRALIEERVPYAVAETNFDEALVPSYALPDIFTLNSGQKVRSRRTWEQHRRVELLQLFQDNVFGVSPSRPNDLHFKVVEHQPDALEGSATYKRVAISFHLGENPFTFHLKMFLPNRRQGNVPVFLLLNHRGTIDIGSGFSSQSEFWPVEYAVGRGYAIAVIDVSAEIDPDVPNSNTGVRAFYRNYYKGVEPLTWKTLSAWAWSASRAVDYFETDPDIDATKIAIVGHSRGGKTALWAGAQDSRFALVIPNNAGDGGPSIARRRLGNTIEVMTGRNPHWFVEKYSEYARKERSMPFDQHMLIALVAPRGYHAGDGSEDLWHDPRGAWLALVEASRAWALYDKTREMKDKMPLVNDLLINGPIAYHMRTGGHGLLLYDWKLYLDHADYYFQRN